MGFMVDIMLLGRICFPSKTPLRNAISIWDERD
jgi:hypothetical protein